MTAGGEIAIRTENLSKTYRSGSTDLVVFADLNIEVRRGERLALVGESGAGKSTLLHLLGGLDRPTAGRIFFGDREISGLADGELSEFRNREVGFVWQVHYLLPEFTALENVAMPLLIRRVARAEASAAARQWLAEVGLGHRLEHRPGELSGGERQRAAIARALVTRPACVLMDEPTGNLDRHTAAHVQDTLIELNERHRVALLIVSHDPALAARMQRVLELRDGRLHDAWG